MATDILKEKGRTVVLVRDGGVTQEIELDQSRIEFTTAIDDGDLARAAAFLDSCEQSPEVHGMWSKLAKVAVEAQELKIAHKAYAATGDVPRYASDEEQISQRIYSFFNRDFVSILCFNCYLIFVKLCPQSQIYTKYNRNVQNRTRGKSQ